jgi:hypothetical protein
MPRRLKLCRETCVGCLEMASLSPTTRSEQGAEVKHMRVCDVRDPPTHSLLGDYTIESLRLRHTCDARRRMVAVAAHTSGAHRHALTCITTSHVPQRTTIRTTPARLARLETKRTHIHPHTTCIAIVVESKAFKVAPIKSRQCCHLLGPYKCK